MLLKRLGTVTRTVFLTLMVVAFAPRPGESGMVTRFLLGIAPLCVAWVILLRWRSGTSVKRWVVLILGFLVAASIWSSLPWTGWVTIWPLIVLGSVVAVAQPQWPVLQYIFFCRFPLLVALALCSLPVIALLGAPLLFRSMFVLGSGGVGIVTALAVLCGSVVLATAELILRTAYLRFDVRPVTKARDWLTRWGRWIVALLVAPVVVTALVLADVSWVARLAGAVLGILAALLVIFLGQFLGDVLTPDDDPSWQLDSARQGWRGLGGAVQRFARRTKVAGTETVRHTLAAKAKTRILGDGYVVDGKLLPGHVMNLSFMAATMALYLAGYWALRPNGPVQAPALAFVIFMLMMLGWILPGISFVADKFRLSTALALAIVPFVLYFINDVDHYYEYYELPAASAVSGPVSPGAAGELRTAFNARLARSSEGHTEGQPVIIGVAAGGGGGSAAYWTALVLTELQREFSERFTDSIHVISAVSGGSVGAMYFVSAFEPPSAAALRASAPSITRLDEVVAVAGRSSLSAAAWGLAYPDFLRVFSVRDPFRAHVDRGWALEEAWNTALGADRGRRVSDWREGTLRGWRAGIFFNATVSETGERLLISPLRLAEAHPACRDNPDARDCEDRVEARTLSGLYPAGADLRLATATRLSATFPFVMPIPRPRRTDNAFHIADGGYYDNDGLLTLVEWARKAFEFGRSTPARKLLLIDIRVVDPVVKARSRTGWIYDTLGPVVTMISARGSSQVLRNNIDLGLLADSRRAGEFSVHRVPFPLTLETSRSWHLPQAEKAGIDAYWKDDPTVSQSRKKIGEILREAGWP